MEGVSQSGGQLGPLQLSDHIESLVMHVHPCIKLQHSTSLMPLLNLSNLFHQGSRCKELVEIEIMTAQALIAARKFIQAIEKLRKIQSQLLVEQSKYINS